MLLDPDAAYLALRARDARFDGRLYVGVTSTRIYCRPICRVRTPRREHCRFFETPAQAEAQAFRPCLKCRPEVAPGPGLAWSVMDASRTLARQAAAWLDAQAADGAAPRLAALAARVGVSERHLRRIFLAEHGVTPVQYVQTRRLLTAKQLLTDTRWPVAQVALASGFRSLRRFNAAFAERYRMSPTRLRGSAAPPADGTDGEPGLVLAFRAPYDAVRMARFLGQRAVPGVEAVEGLRIRRTVRAAAFGAGGPMADAAGWIEVRLAPEAARLHLRVAPSLAPASAALVAAVRRWLDLDAAPETVDAALAGLPGAPGLRLPGSLDPFELAVRAVLGQQVTVAGARTLACRVVERFGEPIATPWPDVHRLFPTAPALSGVPAERIGELGIVRVRAQAIVALARAWPAIAARLGPRQPPEPLIEALCALPGIGPWTAHYIAMRALGWPDAFLPRDVAVLKAMQRLYGCASQREADAVAAAWRPWRAYAVLRLWNTLENEP